jgi:hypothetical protein
MSHIGARAGSFYLWSSVVGAIAIGIVLACIKWPLVSLAVMTPFACYGVGAPLYGLLAEFWPERFGEWNKSIGHIP